MPRLVVSRIKRRSSVLSLVFGVEIRSPSSCLNKFEFPRRVEVECVDDDHHGFLLDGTQFHKILYFILCLCFNPAVDLLLGKRLTTSLSFVITFDF